MKAIETEFKQLVKDLVENPLHITQEDLKKKIKANQVEMELKEGFRKFLETHCKDMDVDDATIDAFVMVWNKAHKNRYQYEKTKNDEYRQDQGLSREPEKFDEATAPVCERVAGKSDGRVNATAWYTPMKESMKEFNKTWEDEKSFERVKIKSSIDIDTAQGIEEAFDWDWKLTDRKSVV